MGIEFAARRGRDGLGVNEPMPHMQIETLNAIPKRYQMSDRSLVVSREQQADWRWYAVANGSGTRVRQMAENQRNKGVERIMKQMSEIETIEERLSRIVKKLRPDLTQAFDDDDKFSFSFIKKVFELAIAEAIAAEREACEQLCKETSEEARSLQDSGAQITADRAATICANKIKRRSPVPAAPKAETTK